MTVLAELRLAVAARPENLALVRQALAGLAEAAGLDERPLADLKQVATEACMNAVVHAYSNGEDGRLEVAAIAQDTGVELRVRDWGAGFRPRPSQPGETGSLRLGLPLIAGLSHSFTIDRPEGGGTEVRAVISAQADPMVSNGSARGPAPPAPREAEIAVSAGLPAKPVIARVFALAATRAGLSLERMSDGVLLGDAISAHSAADFAEGHVGVEITECGPNLCVRIGPLVEGAGQRLLSELELPEGISLAKLADRVEVEHDDAGEFLALELGASSPGSSS